MDDLNLAIFRQIEKHYCSLARQLLSNYIGSTPKVYDQFPTRSPFMLPRLIYFHEASSAHYSPE
jgi:hypothetical protein